jgi:hypothetical protein
MVNQKLKRNEIYEVEKIFITYLKRSKKFGTTYIIKEM